MDTAISDINATLLTATLLAAGMPLLSFVLSFLTSGRYAWTVSLLAPLFLFGSTISSLYLLSVCWNEAPTAFAWHWFQIGDAAITATLSLTNTSVLMLTVVSLISFLVHLYSTGYMAGDQSIRRYFAMLGFFTFAMQGIVLSDNLLLLFVCWELVGFSSYMLIGHWMEKPEAARAAQKAFVINRIGDAGFLVGLMILWTYTGSFSITQIVSSVNGAAPWQTAAALCIFFGIMGKSAQFPLFTWLPDAMEGPTPVSALIHAATMVAAGVYLLIRMFGLFTPDALTVVACTGMITTLLGALSALFQYDIKKVLAYSTISQLGLMVLALGMGVVNAALLHLFTHAFFKACLFLSAGSVIHTLHQAQRQTHDHGDVQDIRSMGGLRKKLPVTFFAFVIGGASLAGIPFFSGFLSKEAILLAIWRDHSILSWFMLATVAAVSFITVLYTFRLIWFVFMGKQRTTLIAGVTESPGIMRAPIILLACCSLWFVVSWNPFDFIGWLLPSTQYTHSPWITAFSVLWIAAALCISYFRFRSPHFHPAAFLENAFYVDRVLRKSAGKLAETSAAFLYALDKRWIDGFVHGSAYAHVTLAHIAGWIDKAILDGLVNGMASLARWTGSVTRSFQPGKIQVYVFWSIFAIIIFLIWTLN